MRIDKLPAEERLRIAAEIVSLQYLSPPLQKIKHTELTRKYGLTFINNFYGDLILRTDGTEIERRVWDWASGNCTKQSHYKSMLDYASNIAKIKPATLSQIVKNCCMKQAKAKRKWT